MIEENAKNYFEAKARQWMEEAYDDSGYSYSTPLQRVRIVKSVLKTCNNIRSILDIGCGGCKVAIELAKLGYEVTALEQSDEMLALAQKNISRESPQVQSRIHLIQGTIDIVFDRKFDCAVALGLIGYLDSDDRLFVACKKNLNENGLLIASFRNRLFNLFSISHRTLAEVDQENFVHLFNELKRCYLPLSHSSVVLFLERLQTSCAKLLETIQSDGCHNDCEDLFDKPIECEPRQSTPDEARSAAQKNDFSVVKLIGVHPHLLPPRANKCLPPRVYNEISNALCCFEEESMALVWSSVFIGVFKKYTTCDQSVVSNR